MLAHLEDLLAVQEKDLRLQQLRQELDRIPKEQEAAKIRLEKVTAAVENAKTTVQENEVAIKNVELDVGTRKETISRLKKQQFETKKNDEYTKLGEEVVRYEGEIDELETKELELMENADQLRQTLAEAQKAFETVNHGVEDEISALEARSTEFKTELESLEKIRSEAISAVPENLSSLYGRLLKTRGAPVVSAVTPDGLCTGCHVKVTPAVKVAVKTGKETVSCENCGRILYPE